jgi:hypothetical protein
MLMLGEPFQTSKGSKSCIVKSEKGLPINVELKDVHSPFGAGVYGGDGSERRVNLDVTVSDFDLAGKLDELDQALVKIVTKASESLFKKKLSPEDVQKNYKPILRPSVDGAYDPKVRTKLNLDSVKIWDNTRKLRDIPPDNFKNAKLSLNCTLKSLWLMPTNSWGAVVECTHILYDEPVIECPFSTFAED